jgi:hypothetical protein
VRSPFRDIHPSISPMRNRATTITTPESAPPSEILDEIIFESPPAIRVSSADTQSSNINNEPTSFQETIRRPDANKWIDAMNAEIDSIMENRTWTLCDLPPGKNCITVKWVFKIKMDGNNKIERYKCRIVARGFSQVAGLDFEETFAPVVRIESVRCLLAYFIEINVLIVLDSLQLFWGPSGRITSYRMLVGSLGIGYWGFTFEPSCRWKL